LFINTSDNKSSKEDAKKIRQSVLMNSVSYITTSCGREEANWNFADLKELEI